MTNGSKVCKIARVLSKQHKTNGILAQLGEHLPYKQRVIGSSPIGPIFMFEMKKNVFMRMHRGVFCVYDEPSTDLCLHKNRYLVNVHHRAFKRDGV